MNIKFVKLDTNAIEPTLGTTGAAAFDLYASESENIRAGKWALVKTGIAMAIPMGMVGMVCSRSGLALKEGIFVLNAPGIIDSDYRGDIGVILYNANDEDFYVGRGDRIAQIMFTPAVTRNAVGAPVLTQVETLDDTQRGTGGFGSTGVSS